MRVPLSWLAELVTWDLPTPALVERMAMSGLTVDTVSEVGDLDARIRVARLEAVERPADADRLAVCRLDVGGDSRATVVSAAPGLAVGQPVVVALAGATLPGGRRVETVTRGGLVSEGVLCTEADVDLGEETGRVLEV